ncbi:MAG: phosphate acetyltransferase [Bacteroidetes bacterium]|nr:phosphate acetyltransferase [Bacteroidota bacterium]
MSILDNIQERARLKKCKIVFPEGMDDRTLFAVHTLLDKQIARPIVLGDDIQIRKRARDLGLNLPSSLPIIDPMRSEKRGEMASELYTLRKTKGMSYEDAKKAVDGVMYYGAMMVRRGECDGLVGGAVHTTADVLRAAIHCVGTAPGIKTVSSIFFMILPDGKAITFGDCAVMPYPDPSQLADIAIASAETHRQLTGEEPLVAMLSFSTKGSAQHESVNKVIEALHLVKQKRPDLKIDGELQFDAAFLESVGRRKAPESEVAGRANVYIFPNLDAGNICYKVTERIGNAQAIGPVIQGLSKPINDLSRGCNAEDIVNVTAICCLKA